MNSKFLFADGGCDVWSMKSVSQNILNLVWRVVGLSHSHWQHYRTYYMFALI